MRFKNLILLTVGLTSALSTAIITPSGIEVPNTLLKYLTCPIGDVICKNGQDSICSENYNICQQSNPNILDELLTKNGHKKGNFTPNEYCKIHLEVCKMIMNYDPPLTKDYIYNLDQYLTCGKDDSICQYGKSNSCREVLKLCWGNYPKDACIKLSDTCKKINSNSNITNITTNNTSSYKQALKKTIKNEVKKVDTKRKTTKRIYKTKKTSKRVVLKKNKKDL
ncbi:hypothetical protein H8356DRAFT_1733794 [Neocallimastix lanati (nom. inval.)]|jgi:hypothetical protein|uniref:Extracellular membrane protein CFEM domain-containing protein n=1 Tax=Neocallimastix californiae TaxID=1754190 RepID=A0A1Y2CFD6_9FUNG|nr:hypothetical protein H8356DRAFT_1733794 [Neocallimastix sp. JGI-2020a]ORY45773.1 hypothetical protein LY90DRAFT_703484 [Neocallimastix californiae]|eukprot:ORY45773.1 hypothetical protein LY90DRAFT_703484 [Neocallimastix californiae]